MKKIEKKSSLQVAFTKRRGGLFRKATELAVLCGVEIAILVKSPAGKLYSFGHPSVEALINRAPAQIRREYEGRDQLGNIEENMKNCALPSSSSSSNLIAADNFVIDAAPPLSLQQLIAADDSVIAADHSLYDGEEALDFFN
ncbi:MADS-box transcription factor 51-like [Salvia splendens]|nr:MADS-box transcription factor 51-like [Salvia splendens]